jgi:hypothetical protein
MQVSRRFGKLHIPGIGDSLGHRSSVKAVKARYKDTAKTTNEKAHIP